MYKALQRRKDMLVCTGFSKAFRKAVDRGAKEMAQQYGALAALAWSLGSVPSTLLVVYNHTNSSSNQTPSSGSVVPLQAKHTKIKKG